MKKYEITPVPKPRMTQRDKWKKRPVVLRYLAFCDECRSLGVTVPESGAHIVFNMPMPTSWSKKKKTEMLGRPHQQRPDIDNLSKALFDAVYSDDSTIWDVRTTKLWAETGSIEIS